MGYINFSLSQNAAMAYQVGKMPLSKWTKSDIINAVIEYTQEINKEIDIEELKKISLQKLKENFLSSNEWHHTAKFFNQTYFYELNENFVENLTLEEIKSLQCSIKKEKPVEYIAEIEYLIWSGSRNYPKATKYTETCKIIGNWAYTKNGKKKVGGNGFKIIKIQEGKNVL